MSVILSTGWRGSLSGGGGCSLTEMPTPDRDPLWTETPGQRPPLDRDSPGQRHPWTETPRQRPHGQRAPGQRPQTKTPRQRPLWIETPLDKDLSYGKERAVCILMECSLVIHFYQFLSLLSLTKIIPYYR